MVTASKSPVPDPIAPMKSDMIDKAPMQAPPKAAAVGMYLRLEQNLPVQFSVDIVLSESSNGHALVLQLLGYILGS
jgi:hypothetical protein